MILKTLTGPTIRAALADARRLFGPTVVLLQSTPEAPGQPASVTVAYDDAPAAPAAPAPHPRPAAPALPDPVVPAARPYGYAAARNVRPPQPEAPAAPRPLEPARHAAPSTAAWGSQTEPTASAPPTAAASAADVAALRDQLARLEAELSRVRAAAPAPVPSRPPLVLVGPAGAGKTSLALRLAQSPHLTDASCAAVLIVAPEAEPFIDPSSVFWDAAVPVVVARTAADVEEALATLADADLLIVDTPSLPLDAARAQPVVARLGQILAPLAAVEVALVLDAARCATTFTAETIDALGLSPDALALTRTDEATDAESWSERLDLPIRVASSGPALSDLSPSPARPARAFRRHDLSSIVKTVLDDSALLPSPSTPVLA